MGRYSCSIQHPVKSSVDVVASFRAENQTQISSKFSTKEQAMKKSTKQIPRKDTKKTLDHKPNKSIKKRFLKSVIVAAASLAIHGAVGNQSA
jgi:hypothetical protein